MSQDNGKNRVRFTYQIVRKMVHGQMVDVKVYASQYIPDLSKPVNGGFSIQDDDGSDN